MVNIANFFYPCVFDDPVGKNPFEFSLKKIFRVSRFDKRLACDGRTGGRTDTGPLRLTVKYLRKC